MAMTDRVKMFRKHARDASTHMQRSIHTSYRYTLEANKPYYSDFLRKNQAHSAQLELERAIRYAVRSAHAAFNAHPELRG